MPIQVVRWSNTEEIIFDALIERPKLSSDVEMSLEQMVEAEEKSEREKLLDEIKRKIAGLD